VRAALIRSIVGLVSGAAILAGAASFAQPASESLRSLPPSLASASRLMAMPGYLPAGAAPNSLLLNPPPPAPGSAAEAHDLAEAKAAVVLRGTPRWELARQDALLSPESPSVTFSCAAGFEISPLNTPRLNALLLRSARDFAMSIYPTKNEYKRQRPFEVIGEASCTPDEEDILRRDSAYPSGHTPLGYGWSLILAEVIPERAAHLIARGRAFGDSRRVCNVHWRSDIEEGRVVGAAVVARLHAVPEFQADLAAAKAEVAALKQRDPGRNCAVEVAALGG
jgi:acid phosphatase (class A)